MKETNRNPNSSLRHSELVTSWIITNVGFLLIFLMVMLLPTSPMVLSIEGAAIRAGIPNVGGRDRSRGGSGDHRNEKSSKSFRWRGDDNKDDDEDFTPTMFRNLSLQRWTRNKKERSATMATRVVEQQQQQHGMSIFGLLFAGLTSGMGSFGRQLSQNNNKLVLAGAAAAATATTLYKVQK